MKKIFAASMIAVLSISLATAQKKEVQSAWNYLRYEQFDKAREAIDKAAAHEQTMNEEKTWFYRGLVYQNLATNDKFAGLAPNALEEAARSYKRAIEIDSNGEFTDDARKNLRGLSTDFFNKGALSLNQDNHQEAINSFKNAMDINRSLGAKETDSLNLLAHLYSAYAAERMKNNELAKTHFQKLIDLKYNDPKIYIFLAQLYKNENDTAKALSALQAGRQAFPDDSNLIIEELNIYLATDRHKEALERLQLAIQKEPNNAALHFALGSIYDKTGEPSKALTAYQKAIEIKPDYFDAYYNLGVMYFNEGAELANKANDIPPKQIKEYEEAKKKADEKFNEAKPFLERAAELNPDDRQTLVTLRQIYARENNSAKVEEINKKIGQ